MTRLFTGAHAAPCSAPYAMFRASQAIAMLALWLGLLGTSSCAESDDALLGTARINLIGQAPSGAVYRLRHATISVVGGGFTQVWNTEDNPDQPSLSADVPVARYTATLAPGWELERIDGSAATRVTAQLVSVNPAAFTVTVHQRVTVPLRFHVDTDDVDLAQGYELVVGVEPSPPMLIVVTNESEDDEGSITVYPVGATGDVAPLRTIAGPLTTLERPRGVTVVDQEIVVCDSRTDAISVFPLLGDGNIAPVRQIVGPETGVFQCTDVAVFDGEVYVSALDEIVIFPVTANGNARPSRRISRDRSDSALAIANGELYATDGDGVRAYSLPVADEAPPARLLSVECADSVTARDGELFVLDGCAETINLYPASASGDASPLRQLGGTSTFDSPSR